MSGGNILEFEKPLIIVYCYFAYDVFDVYIDNSIRPIVAYSETHDLKNYHKKILGKIHKIALTIYLLAGWKYYALNVSAKIVFLILTSIIKGYQTL